MKERFLRDIPMYIAVVLIGFAAYSAGKIQYRKQLLNNVEACADRTLKQDGDLGRFYGHEWQGSVRSYYAHATAFTEMKWSKCFREELRKDA